MNIEVPVHHKKGVVYPERDGNPMADNTLQFRIIVMIQGGLDFLFRDEDNVFVGGDLLWYPVEGNPKIRAAPDALVAFGRPKGDRGSYLQWLEDHIPPQVVFEVLSPGNRHGELVGKFRFYEKYGVEEYYVYDPDNGYLEGYQRAGDELLEIPEMIGRVSPRLKVRFDVVDGELRLYGPDGRPFSTYVELAKERDLALQQAEQLKSEKDQIQQEKETERQRAERLAAKLRELGVEPE